MTLTCAYGTYVPGERSAVKEFHEEIALAEEAGFEGMYFSEHHGLPGYSAAPMELAGFVLGRSAMRSGPMPLLAPLHAPVRVAEQAAMLDFLSEGRLDLGLGLGYMPIDFDQVGIPTKERGARFDECLDVYANVWSPQPSLFEGRFYTLGTEAALAHAPYDGTPRTFIAGAGAKAMERAIRTGSGIVIDSLRGADEVRQIVADYRRACADAGSAVGPVAVMRRAWFGDAASVSDYVSRTKRDLQRYVDATSGSSAPWVEEFRESGVTDAAVHQRAVTGPPEGAAELIGRWARDAGVDQVQLKLQWGHRDFDQLRDQLILAKDFVSTLLAGQDAQEATDVR